MKTINVGKMTRLELYKLQHSDCITVGCDIRRGRYAKLSKFHVKLSMDRPTFTTKHTDGNLDPRAIWYVGGCLWKTVRLLFIQVGWMIV